MIYLLMLLTLCLLNVLTVAPQRDDDSPPYFKKLIEMSRRTFDAERAGTQNPEEKKLKYPYNVVSLDPVAGSYGGVGNLIFGILGVEGLALATGKVSVINHAVIQSMFLHPDIDYGQRYDILSTDDMKDITQKRPMELFKGIHEMKPCRQWYPVEHLAKMVFVHNCNGQAINHPAVQRVLAPIFDTEENHGNYFRKVASGLLSWFSSNPTPHFKKFSKMHKDIILHHCGRDTTSSNKWETAIDLTIQIRNFKDLGVYEKLSCYQDCMMRAVDMAIKRRAKYVNGESAVCVYITSDNETTTDLISDFLAKNKSVNLMIHTDKSSQFHLGDVDWHTVGLLNDMRLHYNYSMLEFRYDLLDWMTMRDSLAAIYTQESTFSKTSRMSAGYKAQINDLKYGHGENDKCYCERGIDEYAFDI